MSELQHSDLPVRIAALAVQAATSQVKPPANSPKMGPKLRREVVPFSNDVFYGRGSVANLIPNPDPILASITYRKEEEWRTMERACPMVTVGKQKRMRRLLSYGTHLQSAGDKPAQKLLFDAGLTCLKSINRLPATLALELDGIYWGWRPMEITYDFARLGGSSILAPRFVRDKMPEDFSFDVNRRFFYTGDGYGDPVSLNSPTDRFKWIWMTAGSTDSPYGAAWYRPIWWIYRMQQAFYEILGAGFQRSVGIVKAKRNVTTGSQLLGGSGSAMTADEVLANVQRVMQILTSEGVLVEDGTWTLEFDTDLTAVDAWMTPITYCDAAIDLLMTGQTLTSRIGNNGSRAAATVHENILHTYCQGDAKELESWMNDGLLSKFYALNYGEVDPADVPRFRSKIPQQDPIIEAAQILFEMGLKVEGRQLAEASRVPIADGSSDDEIVLEKKDTQALLPFGAPPPNRGEPRRSVVRNAPKDERKENDDEE